jgi:NAD(P)-dependent dehydrogenase (short-subunit alcohol dehydrogenase family)
MILEMKTIFITGISKGLGKELLSIFISKGYFVFGLLRNEILYNELLCTKPNNAAYILADVSSDACSYAIQQVVKDSKIDLLINNAGIQANGMDMKTATADEILSLLNVHCLGAFRVIKALHNNLDSGSTIVNVNSRLGSIKHQQVGTFKTIQVSYAYRIAKAAQNMLTTCLRLEFESLCIASITPGRLSTQAEYAGAAHRIVAHWEDNKFDNANGILEIPHTITEW